MAVADEFAGLSELFRRKYGREAAWFVRAPGRVNLIGEHTDYNGYPVLPMAIQRAIRLAAAPGEGRLVELTNGQSDLYGDRQFELSDVIPRGPGGDWSDYVKAAVQSLVRLGLDEGRSPDELRGICCAVEGDLPPAAGLSSSTALVVAAALAFCAVNRMGLGRQALAERMADAEHYVGTQGGGMDQAVCLLARAGEVLRLDFFPLQVQRLPFPEDHCIVAAHSTLPAGKAAERRLAYNRRVIECTIGLHLLARELGVKPPPRLADLSQYVANAEAELPHVLQRVMKGHESLSLRAAASLFETDPGRFARRFLRMADGRLLPMPGDGLKVLRRCRHVFGEARRVERAAACLARGDMAALGSLMDESHASCAADLGISTFEVDQLVDVMRQAGALGARLTGAGFGGFAIALVHVDAAEQVRQAVAQRFHDPRGASADGYLLVFRPADGALDEPVD